MLMLDGAWSKRTVPSGSTLRNNFSWSPSHRHIKETDKQNRGCIFSSHFSTRPLLQYQLFLTPTYLDMYKVAIKLIRFVLMCPNVDIWEAGTPWDEKSSTLICVDGFPL